MTWTECYPQISQITQMMHSEMLTTKAPRHKRDASATVMFECCAAGNARRLAGPEEWIDTTSAEVGQASRLATWRGRHFDDFPTLVSSCLCGSSLPYFES